MAKINWNYISCKPTEVVRIKDKRRLFLVELKGKTNGTYIYKIAKLWTKDDNIKKAIGDVVLTPRTEYEISDINY